MNYNSTHSSGSPFHCLHLWVVRCDGRGHSLYIQPFWVTVLVMPFVQRTRYTNGADENVVFVHGASVCHSALNCNKVPQTFKSVVLSLWVSDSGFRLDFPDSTLESLARINFLKANGTVPIFQVCGGVRQNPHAWAPGTHSLRSRLRTFLWRFCLFSARTFGIEILCCAKTCSARDADVRVAGDCYDNLWMAEANSVSDRGRD